MGNTRFNGLALMTIHCDNDVGVIELDNVLRRFDSTGHLRIDASSLTLLCDMFSQTGEKVNIYCPRRCHQRHISDRNLLDLLLT